MIEENSLEDESFNMELDFAKEIRGTKAGAEGGDGAGALEISIESMSSLIQYEGSLEANKELGREGGASEAKE